MASRGAGRPSNNSKLLYFNYKAYYRDVVKAVKKALNSIKKTIVSDMKYKVASINFKTNKVRLAGDLVSYTSDAERKHSVIDSIESSKIMRDANDSLRVYFMALNKNFKDSHIGIYYEYGTGENAIEAPSKIKRMAGTPNKVRAGKEIVSRSKHINYAGQGKGKWYDMGGNLRITGSPEAGVHDSKFKQYIGEDVEAKQWFGKALKNRDKYIKQQIIAAVRSVPLGKYLVIKPVFKLGRD